MMMTRMMMMMVMMISMMTNDNDGDYYCEPNHNRDAYFTSDLKKNKTIQTDANLWWFCCLFVYSKRCGRI